LQVRSYEARDGRRQKAAEVVASRIQFLDRKKGKDVLPAEQPTLDAEVNTGAEDAPV
jgi:single-stranded DNA-binding protein